MDKTKLNNNSEFICCDVVLYTDLFLIFRIKNMHVMIQQQSTLLQQIATKLDVTGPGMPTQDPLICMNSNPFTDMGSGMDRNSLYDNVSLSKIQRNSRYKSVRVSGSERPQSVMI